MNPASGISGLSQALHSVAAPKGSGTPLSKRERFGSAATSLRRLVQDEWDRAGSKQEHHLPLPPMRSHSARSSTSYSALSSYDPPRFVAQPPPELATSHLPPSPPDSPDMGDTPAAPVLDKGKGRQSEAQEVENAALNAALEASLYDPPLPQLRETPSDAELREVLEQSRDDELARQHHAEEQERSDLTAALMASSASTPGAAGAHTLYRARSQTLPAFSASDEVASAYLPEKARLFPQGRPALPPGAGSAWDDEQREMEMLADAIRISQEEEDERRRIEEAEVEEALRQSERAATSGDESAGTAATDSSAEGTGGSSVSATAMSPRDTGVRRKERRRSWLRPPLSSKLSSTGSSPPSSPTASAAPLPPARPLLPSHQSSAPTVTTYRTARESLPFSNLDAVVPSSAGPPARPSRPPPPPPAPPAVNRASPRLPPTPPETPHVGAAAFSASTTGTAARLPSLPPPPQHLAIPEQYRHENDGSPYELPFLTPSSSLRSTDDAHDGRFLRPSLGTAAAQWDSHSGGSVSFEPLSTSSPSGEQSRRASGTYATASGGASASGGGGDEEDSRSASSLQSSESAGPPLSPLDIRNPDGWLASSSATSSQPFTATSISSPNAGAGDRGLWIEDLPTFPTGLTGVSAYGGRSMSAIDEMTEPASSVIATEVGGVDEDAHADADEDGFPAEVSLGSAGAGAFPLGLPDEPSSAAVTGAASTSEAAWIAGLDTSPHRRPPPALLHRESAARTPTLPPGAAAPASSSVPAARIAAGAADVGEHDLDEDGIRSGYPAPCALELVHACPADGLVATADVPARIELASDPNGGDGGGDGDGAAARRDAWAIEAHSWVALVRALMWHGDATIVAAPADRARNRAQRCAATARLEFRPDDEGLPVLRLVIALVPAHDASTHLAAHRELSVSRPPPPPPLPSSKGKRPAAAAAAAAAVEPLAAFALPDLLHLPTRLSSLAIQLYTLRHLAGIARATQPSRSPAPAPATATDTDTGTTTTAAGYPALRELADAIAALARAAQDRERERDPGRREAASRPGPGTASAVRQSRQRAAIRQEQEQEPGKEQQVTPPEEQNARLLTRLRDRLRRLKRRSGGGGAPVAASSASASSAGSGAETAGFRPPPPPPAPPGLHRDRAAPGGASREGANKLVKPMPTPRATAVRRSERVLAAEEGGPEPRVRERERERERAKATERERERERERGRTAEQREMRYLPML
ncbi:hypothetical protein JCM3770_006041 [Rhodotorula araucariae]